MQPAEHFFRRAIEVNPGDATAHNRLGGMLCAMKSFDEAFVHFAQSLTLRPDFPQTRRYTFP